MHGRDIHYDFNQKTKEGDHLEDICTEGSNSEKLDLQNNAADHEIMILHAYTVYEWMSYNSRLVQINVVNIRMEDNGCERISAMCNNVLNDLMKGSDLSNFLYIVYTL
jgi:hypothetical protein